jgi:MOSC domain-containing protein
MPDYKLTQLKIYPVKSLSGISLEESVVEERGFKYDRRWMLVDNENMFITQRLFPQMVFINVKIENGEMVFTHKRKKIEDLKISLIEYPQNIVNVKIWDDFCDSNQYGKEVNDWFSEAIESKCKLVHMPETSKRGTSTKYFKESKNVSFADGYPFLIIGEESLNYLNSKLDKPVFMDQFRPNIVFSGGSKHDEDNWNSIRIGELEFSVVKPCARCVITTIDTATATKNKEPLATLSTYRKFNSKIMFGQNAIGYSNGKLRISDKITLL